MSVPQPIDQAEPIAGATAGDDARRLVLTLARALHAYGTPADQLESALERCARTLGLRGQFFSTPTSLFVAFGETTEQRTHLLRVDPGDADLAKLARLDEILDAVVSGAATPSAAAEAVERVVASPPRWGAPATIACTGLVSGAAAIFLRGGWIDAGAAATIGLVIGVLALVVSRSRRLARLFEMAAGALAVAIAAVVAHYVTPIPVLPTAIAGLILLVPGLTLTIAVSELAARHLASGTARLMGATMILFSLGFGVAVGLRATSALVPRAAALDVPPVPTWVVPALLVPSAVAFAVLFRARLRDFVPILVATAAGFYATRAGAHLLGEEIGVSLGAFVVAAGSSLHARVRRCPALVTLLPGLLMLVPGVLGFRGFAAMLDANTTLGVEGLFDMLFVAMSIVAGLLAAAVAVPPRRVL